MEGRSSIQKLSKDESLTHTGGLTITGDIEENAKITLTDGSLTVLGSIKNGAKITLRLSEELRKAISVEQVVSSMSSTHGVVMVSSGLSSGISIGK